MRLLEFLNVTEDVDVERDMDNPMPKKIDMHNPLFGEWAAIQDEVELSLMQRAYQAEGGTGDIPLNQYKARITALRNVIGKVVTVDPKTLISSEPTLHQDHMDALLSGKKVKMSSDIPVVYKMGNKVIIGDGNHRVAADFIRGGKSKVLLVDLMGLAKKYQIDLSDL